MKLVYYKPCFGSRICNLLNGDGRNNAWGDKEILVLITSIRLGDKGIRVDRKADLTGEADDKG